MRLLAICLAYFMVILDATIVNVALPDVQSDLDGGVTTLQWIVDGYTLALHALADIRPSGERRGLDLTGQALAAVALTAIVAGLIEPSAALALAGLAVGAAFIVGERRARDPMLPLGLFARPRFAAANA